MSSVTQQVRNVFLVPQDLSAERDALLALADAAGPAVRQIALAFADNLLGVVQTLSIPFHYAYSEVHSLHWQRVHMAERIRARGLADESQQDAAALANAKEKFSAYLQADGRDRVAEEVIQRLNKLRADPESLQAARELTRQGLVLTWSAVEVLCRDLFVHLLNSRPALANALLSDPGNRKRFSADRIEWQTLAAYDFNLSHSLGTYLVSRADLTNVPAIRAAYGALFPEATELRNQLGDDNFWHLSQKRHLIVHRRGIVDQDYIDATGTSLSIGETLWVTPGEVEAAIAVGIAAGKALFGAVADAA